MDWELTLNCQHSTHFRPIPSDFSFLDTTTDGERTAYAYPGFRFTPPGAAKISPPCGWIR